MSKDKYERSLKNLNMLRRPVLNNVTNTTDSSLNTFGKVLRQAKSKLQNNRGNITQSATDFDSNTGSSIPLREGPAIREDKENLNPLGKIDEREELEPSHKTLTTQKHVTIDDKQQIIGYSHLGFDKSAPSTSSSISSSNNAASAGSSATSSFKTDPRANTDGEMLVKSHLQTKQDDIVLHRREVPDNNSDDATGSGSGESEKVLTNTTSLNDNSTTSTNAQLMTKQLEAEDSKKRPISTVVEQALPKKFKVCEKGKEYEWEDLDEEDINDPFMVSEYVNDIFEYLHRLEMMTLPNRHELFKHANIQQNRDILVNWMVKIHNKFGLLPETLYLALNIMDRFLCKELVQLEKLQLVGTACLFIASKYEEVYSPSVKHFAYETDGACDEEEIKEGEKFILKTLEFNLNYPNPMNFLRRISKADDYDIQSRTLAKYLLEISIVDFKFIGILPSLCAAASMFLSRKMLGKGKWDGNLIHYSGGYTKDELAPVCNMVMEYLVQPVVHDELFKKYASRRFMKASVISRQWAKKVMSHNYDIMTLHDAE